MSLILLQQVRFLYKRCEKDISYLKNNSVIPCLIKFNSIKAIIGEKSNIPKLGTTRFIGSSIGSVISTKNLVIELLVLP